jgi:hypothetical protein
MKDIGIYYKSTCCGMFVLYYILGSDQKFNVTARNKELDFGSNKKLMTAMFYKQFQKQKAKGLTGWTNDAERKEHYHRMGEFTADGKWWSDWTSKEYWPDNTFKDKDFPKVWYFQLHDNLREHGHNYSQSVERWDYRLKTEEEIKMIRNFKNLDCIKINPYVSEPRKWYKMQYAKRTGSCGNVPKKNPTFADVRHVYQTGWIEKQGGAVWPSKLDYCDYSFDILKFLVTKEERQRLCDYIGITMNERMEKFLVHYLECHPEKLLKKLYGPEVERPVGKPS